VIVLKSESLNLLEPSVPVKACNGIALPLLLDISVGGVEQKMKPHPIFFVSVKPWLHADMHLGSFCLEPEDIKSIRLGAIWNFCKVTGLP
jgi:hypothetical protein